MGVIARLDRAIQYSATTVIEPRALSVLDARSSRDMTAELVTNSLTEGFLPLHL